jgi:nitroreductase
MKKIFYFPALLIVLAFVMPLAAKEKPAKNAVLKNIYERRSVRAYEEKGIPEELVREILKAGVWAPNGMGTEPLRFVVISDRKVLKKYSELAKKIGLEEMKKARAAADPSKQGGMDSLIGMLSDPKFELFYGAPVLILVFSVPDAFTPLEDGSLGAENMMLAARSLGLGSCWIGFAAGLDNPSTKKELGVPQEYRLIAPLIFGYPRGGFPEGRRNDPVILKWVK